MHTETIIRAWKDDAFRQSLSPEQQASLPAHPAGLVELNDEALADAAGGLTLVGECGVPTADIVCEFVLSRNLGGTCFAQCAP